MINKCVNCLNNALFSNRWRRRVIYGTPYGVIYFVIPLGTRPIYGVIYGTRHGVIYGVIYFVIPLEPVRSTEQSTEQSMEHVSVQPMM